MRNKLNFGSAPSNQRGAVLIVGLVILLIMTVLGVSNIQSSSLQMKMATNSQGRQQAFEAAEAALVKIEAQLEIDGHDPLKVQGCTVNNSSCFDTNCAGGLCFNGTYAVGDFPGSCALSAVSPPAEPYWRNTTLDVWESNGKHLTVDIDIGGDLPDPKYIVEFLCYTDEQPEPAPNCATDPDNCAPLYRITALATSVDEKARVMLQSTYRITD